MPESAFNRPRTAPPERRRPGPPCHLACRACGDLQRKPCPQPRLAASPPNLASHSSSSASDRQGQFEKRPPGSVRKPAARGVRSPAVCRRNLPAVCRRNVTSQLHPVFASSVRIQCSIQCSQFILLEGFGFGSVPVFAVHIVGRVRFQCSVPVFATMLAVAILLATSLTLADGGTAQEAGVVAVLNKVMEAQTNIIALRDSLSTKWAARTAKTEQRTVNRKLMYGNTTALIQQSFQKQNLALGLTFINVAFVSIYVIIVSLCALITKIREFNEKKQQEMFEMFEQKHKDQKRENQRDSRSRRKSEPRVAAAASLA